MNPVVFPGVEPMTTHHCVTGSLRRVLEANGTRVSEEMLLGLGAGIGFSYFHIKGTDPFYGGRANFDRPGTEGLATTAGRRLGVGVRSQATSSRRKAEAALMEMLGNDEPVMLFVDMAYLPYLGLPEDYHFGGHTVAVVGFEEDMGVVLVGDRDDGFHEMSLDELEKARASTFKPFPPQHRWYEFDFSNAHEPTVDGIWESIADTASFMVEPPISNFGVKGIRKAAKLTLKWPEVMDTESLQRTCLNTSFFIDATGGTGGGIFRYMYGRFLDEAAAITGTSRLMEIGKGFHQVGDTWETVAISFRRAAESPDPTELLKEAVAPMHGIADSEEALWVELLELARTD